MIARPMLAVLALLALNASARAAEEVIVLVNGVPITADEVNQVVRGAISGRGEPPSSEEIAQLTEAARNSLIDFELLAQAAKARGIVIDDKQVDAEIARNRAHFASPAEYDKAVAASGLSRDALRADTRKTLLVNTMLDTVVWKDVKVSPTTVQAYYDQHKDKLGGKSFDDLRPAIEQSLRDDARVQLQRAYVGELRKAAKIEQPGEK